MEGLYLSVSECVSSLWAKAVETHTIEPLAAELSPFAVKFATESWKV